ncbi:somatostatin receptor type 2-like [Oratosquilla oratoria]|uniref:somatostatin receptor type 2-like n=1 Tax=Oratosquilla oratoria TaxID=337810 RepID=UPI003F76CD65
MMSEEMETNWTLYQFDCSLLNLSADFNLTYDCNSSNSNGIFEGQPAPMTLVARIVTLLCYAITFVVGLCGNSLVIYVVARFSKMQTVTNLYILNLALADELFVIGIPFLMVTFTLEYWPFGSIMCKLYMISTSINQFTSSLFLTIMSADRYMAVCHPITSPKVRTPMISKLVSLTAWTVSALTIVPIFMYSNTLEYNGLESCNIVWPDGQTVSGITVFTMYSFFLAFGIPLSFISIFYTFVILKLRTVGPKTKSKEKKKSRRKVTKLVLTVITVYVLCWLPYWVLQLALITSPPKQNQSLFRKILFLFTSCLSYINSAINPILYAFLSDNFKKSFMKACTCATNKDVNNALHIENSVFTRRNRGGSSRARPTTREAESVDCTHGCVSKDPSTALTMTSRTPLCREESHQRNGKLPDVLMSHL